MLYMTTLIHLAEEMITHDQPISIHITGPNLDEHAINITPIQDEKGWPKFSVTHWLTFVNNTHSEEADDGNEWNFYGYLVNSGAFDHAVSVAAQALIAILQGKKPQYVNQNGEPA